MLGPFTLKEPYTHTHNDDLPESPFYRAQPQALNPEEGSRYTGENMFQFTVYEMPAQLSTPSNQGSAAYPLPQYSVAVQESAPSMEVNDWYHEVATQQAENQRAAIAREGEIERLRKMLRIKDEIIAQQSEQLQKIPELQFQVQELQSYNQQQSERIIRQNLEIQQSPDKIKKHLQSLTEKCNGLENYSEQLLNIIQRTEAKVFDLQDQLGHASQDQGVIEQLQMENNQLRNLMNEKNQLIESLIKINQTERIKRRVLEEKLEGLQKGSAFTEVERTIEATETMQLPQAFSDRSESVSIWPSAGFIPEYQSPLISNASDRTAQSVAPMGNDFDAEESTRAWPADFFPSYRSSLISNASGREEQRAPIEIDLVQEDRDYRHRPFFQN